ncbi:MAG: hypothetical protein QOG85_2128 [Gaiellaceae bacterium]|nr:hypothetical protein [Gaiellaceae bacterium]
MEAQSRASEIPRRLLQRLDDLGAVLATRGDAIALLALGSVGRDLERLDDHSDLDFFAVVEDGAKQRYLDSIDWLEELAPVVFSFANTVDGRKVLFGDGLFAEYAVFTLGELRSASYPPGRIVWRRADAPTGLEEGGRLPGPSPHDDAEHQANEALTNLYVGLQRDARGERLSATRLIQVHAVDRLLTFLELTTAGNGPRQDVFAIERGAEGRFPSDVLPLSLLVRGYEGNGDAALTMLAWFEERVEVNAALAAAIRRLAEPST